MFETMECINCKAYDTCNRYNLETMCLLVRFIEYNNNTSAGHPIKDDDIVRHSFEKRRVKDKEP
jgi:hypothetical protein